MVRPIIYICLSFSLFLWGCMANHGEKIQAPTAQDFVTDFVKKKHPEEYAFLLSVEDSFKVVAEETTIEMLNDYRRRPISIGFPFSSERISLRPSDKEVLTITTAPISSWSNYLFLFSKEDYSHALDTVEILLKGGIDSIVVAELWPNEKGIIVYWGQPLSVYCRNGMSIYKIVDNRIQEVFELDLSFYGKGIIEDKSVEIRKINFFDMDEDGTIELEIREAFGSCSQDTTLKMGAETMKYLTWDATLQGYVED